MNSVGIYVRLSVEDMDKHNKLNSRSIENQKEMLLDYCKEHDWQLYDVYIDDDISGMERNRKDFQRMLRDCEEGKIDTVLCKDQSRFARDDALIKEYLHTKFVIWGIRFIGVSDGVDSESPDFMDNSSIRGFFNEWYVRDISKKMRATLELKQKQGKFCHASPYGYLKDPTDNNHLIPDPATKDVVLSIFQKYADGMSLSSIAEELNALEIPSPTAYKTRIYPKYRSRYTDNVWSSDSLRTIIANEAYIGNCVSGKSRKISYRDKKKKSIPRSEWIRVEGTHEAIIPLDLWERTHKRIGSRARASRETQEIQPLSGKIICGVCGKYMVRKVQKYHRKSDNEYISISYYRCPDVSKGKGTCDNSKCVNFKKLNELVLEAINNAISSYSEADVSSIADLKEGKLNAFKQQYKQIKDKIGTTAKRLDAIYFDKIDGVITASDYLRYKEQFNLEVERLTSQLSEIQIKIEELNSNEQTEQRREEIIKRYSNVTELTRQIADDFIDCIVVGAVDSDGQREVTINLSI